MHRQLAIIRARRLPQNEGVRTMRNDCSKSALPVVRMLFAALLYGVACGAGHAQPGATAAIVAPGQIDYGGNRMLIGTAATGTVAELPVRAGARVQAGQLLL